MRTFGLSRLAFGHFLAPRVQKPPKAHGIGSFPDYSRAPENKEMTEGQSFFRRYDVWLVVAVASILSIAFTTYYYQHGLVLAYGDAESHINIAKRVVDGLTPGLGQLGGIWLPLQHLLMVPFVWNDWLWRTGLGGSLVSMLAYVFSCVILYKLVKLLTHTAAAAVAAAAIFALNSNVAYMQSTPMSELPLLAAMLGSVYFFVKWALGGQVQDLVLTGFFAFLGSLIRYDAWSLIAAEGAVIFVIGMLQRWRWSKLEGVTIVFITIAALGIVLWILWNYAIFHQPLYFMNSPYSAKSQQMGFLQRGQLPSYHDITSALKFYSVTTLATAGAVFSGLALVGVVVSFVRRQVSGARARGALALSTIMSPFAFNILTLYMGISILFIPQLLPADFEFPLFNVRYGMMMLPAIAVYVAIVLAVLGKRPRVIASIGIVVVAAVMLFVHRPITLADGTWGLSARRPSPANTFIASNYDYGYIAFDDYSRSASPVQLNIPMDKMIYVGNHPFWEYTMSQPQDYVRWLIIRHAEDGSDGDSLWMALRYNQNFLNNFEQVYRNGDSYVYRARGESPREMRYDRRHNEVIFVHAK